MRRITRNRLIVLIVAGLAGAAVLFLNSSARRLVVWDTAHETGERTVLDEPVTITPQARPPLIAYTHPALAALFGQPQPPPVVEIAPPQVVTKVAPQPPPPPLPDPLAGYVFSGMVTVGGETYALMENRATRAGKYVAVGDDFQGFHVSAIERDGITFAKGEEPRRLALNNKYSLTPLSKDSAAAESGTAQVASASPSSAFAATFLSGSGVRVLAYTGGESIDQLHDDYYAGKISLDELNQRASNTPMFLSNTISLYLNDISASYKTLSAKTSDVVFTVKQP